MTRRRATILSHWAAFLLLILLLAGGPSPVLAWGYVAASGLMCALALVLGLLNGPGPKLTGAMRALHPWQSRGMYVVLGLTGLATLGHLLGRWPFDLPLERLWFVALSLSSLHAVFHLWRHTALGDGALRRITPRTLHGIL
ncbi:MAG: hypothetical protein EP307_12980 [Rhodobacteraceae bacterium]|nr:MAG: hypothetical protein EP307_12980 [Paracoccaceae bacterium]